MEIKKFTLEEWNKISKEIHAYSFGEERDPSMNTFDFALMVFSHGEPQAYCTCIELDRESVYMQHGGKLPGSDGTIKIAKSYALLVKHLMNEYENIGTRIKNTNRGMLKLALSAGLIPTGIDNIFKETYLTFNFHKTGEH